MPGPEQTPIEPTEPLRSISPDPNPGEMNYDHLFDPTYEGGSVEAAAVPEAISRTEYPESEVALEGINLARKAQAPMTESDIAKLSASRGKPVTAEEVKYMNMARERGIHHSTVQLLAQYVHEITHGKQIFLWL